MSDCRLVPILVILSLYCVGNLYSNFDLNFEFIYSNNNFWRSFLRYFLDDSVFSLLRLNILCFSIFYDNMFLISFKFYLYFTKPIKNQELVLLVHYGVCALIKSKEINYCSMKLLSLFQRLFAVDVNTN